MKTQLNDVLDELHKLIDASIFKETAEIEGPYEYVVKEQWPATIPNTRNGIYFYTSLARDILYIGKGVYSNNGGIGYRVCSHLGATSNDPSAESILPFHQWAEDTCVKVEFKEAIKNGHFIIWTLPVQPDYIIPMVEVCLQTIYWHHNLHLPPLNKKLG